MMRSGSFFKSFGSVNPLLCSECCGTEVDLDVSNFFRKIAEFKFVSLLLSGLCLSFHSMTNQQ